MYISANDPAFLQKYVTLYNFHNTFKGKNNI
jgi:hypothetical protein